MNRYRQTIGYLLVTLSSLLLISCVDLSRPTQLTITTSRFVNQTEAGQALPLAIRLYPLADVSSYQELTNAEWLQRSQHLTKGALQSETFQAKTILVDPGKQERYRFYFPEDIHFLAVLISPHQPHGQRIRKLIQLDPIRHFLFGYRLNIGRNGIQGGERG